MYKATQKFIKTFDDNEWKYDVIEAENNEQADQVQTGFGATNLTSITLNAFFDADDGPVHVRVFGLAKATDENVDKVYKVLNELNSQNNFVRFFLDDEDKTVTVAADAVFCDDDIEEVCVGLMMAMHEICDQAYPQIMKALWS